MKSNTLLADGKNYTCYVGLETDLIFNQGVDLPEFASFPLLETDAGRARLASYVARQIDISEAAGMGAILETATWMANADRAAPLGYRADQIATISARAIELTKAADTRSVPVLISGNIGPRGDAYAPDDQMNISDARNYHMTQIKALADAGADLVSGFTLAYSTEAVGIALAAKDCQIPVVISFTVETDGRLPCGETLADAIRRVDAETSAYPAYYMINCAHPDHFAGLLDNPIVAARLAGLVVNASRCSHAELDEAEELDDGDPVELGAQLGELAARYPGLRVFGGCCGTDARHIEYIAQSVAKARE